MLLQTNSYIVPREKRADHARLMRRFRQTLSRLGCDQFEVYEQVGANWSTGETNGRFVQIMRFRDRRHQLSVQNSERTDATAQSLIREFCELVNFPYQQQQGWFAVGFYNSVLPVAPARLRIEGQGEEDHSAAVAVPAVEGHEEDDELAASPPVPPRPPAIADASLPSLSQLEPAASAHEDADFEAAERGTSSAAHDDDAGHSPPSASVQFQPVPTQAATAPSEEMHPASAEALDTPGSVDLGISSDLQSEPGTELAEGVEPIWDDMAFAEAIDGGEDDDDPLQVEHDADGSVESDAESDTDAAHEGHASPHRSA